MQEVFKACLYYVSRTGMPMFTTSLVNMGIFYALACRKAAGGRFSVYQSMQEKPLLADI